MLENPQWDFLSPVDITVLLKQIPESTTGAQQQTPFAPLLQGFLSLPLPKEQQTPL